MLYAVCIENITLRTLGALMQHLALELYRDKYLLNSQRDKYFVHLLQSIEIIPWPLLCSLKSHRNAHIVEIMRDQYLCIVQDMFAEFYRKQLAKRLLLNRSASDDDERSLITKLKYRCGAQFTSKLEGMLTDINVSRDSQNQFSSVSDAETLFCALYSDSHNYWP